MPSSPNNKNPKRANSKEVRRNGKGESKLSPSTPSTRSPVSDAPEDIDFAQDQMPAEIERTDGSVENQNLDKKAATHGESLRDESLLQRCMHDPNFRNRVISRLIDKLRYTGRGGDAMY